MQNTGNIFRLKGTIQHYDWGGTQFLSGLLNIPNPENKPCAEYWLGAHSKSPAMVLLQDGSFEKLDALISSDPERWLGKQALKEFGTLPYLLKVQDVGKMLSIQVHPSKAVAEQKFEEENKKGVPLSAPERNYKDSNHKPELLSPLGDFYLLHGFKPPDHLSRILQAVPELNFLQPIFGSSDYRRLYTTVMTMPQDEVTTRLTPLLERIIPLYSMGNLQKTEEGFWAARAASTFNKNGDIDRGIFSIYLFNIVKMTPGEALFQDAGLPHAYLEGHTMEIMANSDNVLRGGLTPKHIDVPELLEHIRFEPTFPRVIGNVPGSLPEQVYPTPARDFQLSRLLLKPAEAVTLNTETADIFFIYQGKITAVNGEQELGLVTGEAIIAAPGSSIRFTASAESILFRATAQLGS